MAVVREFTLPDLGEGLTEAEIVRWLVQVGEVVAVDQPVVEMETAKAVVEVPCPYGGVVTARFGEEGESLAVGRPLVTVAVGSAADSAHPADGDAGGDGQGSGNVLVGYGTGAAVARRRQRVRATARPAGGAADLGRGGRGPGAARGRAGRPRGQCRGGRRRRPGGRHLAAGQAPRPGARPGSAPASAGSGPEGLILRSDVERAIAAPAPSEATDGAERVPLRGIRRAVAEKLTRSRREIPDATCWVDADATELLAARAAMNASGERRISVLALLARVVTAALARYPDLNSTVDTERSEIVRLPAVHLGFAAQTDRGLVVPVLRDAHTMTTTALAAEIARLTEAARTGSLTPAELTGGTFTLNNYGVFGVDGSTPIINHPEAAMLGVGRIAAKPWVHEGELAVREVVQLSFTFDHRVCDGGTAGGFLRLVADCVEQPAVLLAGV